MAVTSTRDAFPTTNGLTLTFALDAPVVNVDHLGRATYAFPLTDGPTLVDFIHAAGADRRDAFEGLRYVHATACRFCGADDHYDDDCTA